MKNLAIAVAVVILAAAAIGFYRLVPRQAAGGAAGSAPVSTERTTSFSVQSGGTVAELEFNGKKLRFAIGGQDAQAVELKLVQSITWIDGRPDATIQVTIKQEQPLLLSRTSFDKIQDGMTYAQVGEILGGVLVRGELSDGFTSRLRFIQGKHQIDLKFVDGKIAERSSKDLE